MTCVMCVTCVTCVTCVVCDVCDMCDVCDICDMQLALRFSVKNLVLFLCVPQSSLVQVFDCEFELFSDFSNQISKLVT